MKQTAVEQAAVALRLWSNAWREFDKTGKNKPESFEKVIEPFIQMEKEQIVDGIVQTMINKLNIYSEVGILNLVEQGEQYYNETFKQQEQ
jgi:hypothetical protein